MFVLSVQIFHECWLSKMLLCFLRSLIEIELLFNISSIGSSHLTKWWLARWQKVMIKLPTLSSRVRLWCRLLEKQRELRLLKNVACMDEPQAFWFVTHPIFSKPSKVVFNFMAPLDLVYPSRCQNPQSSINKVKQPTINKHFNITS